MCAFRINTSAFPKFLPSFYKGNQMILRDKLGDTVPPRGRIGEENAENPANRRQ